MTAESSSAQARWELENSVQSIDDVDSYFQYDLAEQQAIQQQKPWSKDPHHYKHVHISALALLKMAMHAKSGGNLEVMGMLQGKVRGDTFIVIDAFALPVEGTETRVNAQAEAYEYIVDFAETNKKTGRMENMVGWYHSHPGYGCWLSGIDCSTQMIQQQYQEPFLAIVVDPHRTIAAGKVEIGAFRTYPEGYKAPDEPSSEYQTIPLNKIEDFGVHAKQYYSLEVSYFKSALDSYMLEILWNTYWVNTLSSSPLINTADLTAGQITDIAEKLEAAEGQLAHSGRMGRYVMPLEKKKDEQQLMKVTRDSSKFCVEQVKGVSTQVVKELLFNHRLVSFAGAKAAQSSAAAAEPMET